MDSETKKTIEKIKEFLLEKYSPSKIILFGSSARGDRTEFSDIDLCMIINEKPKEGIAEFKVQISEDMLSLRITTAIDLLVISKEDFEKQKKSKYSVYKEIENEGVVLYERS